MNKIKQISYPVLFVALFVILSWILIHLLSVFGVFLAIAYPIWWLIAPQQTICVMCRSGKEGGRCIFCKRTIVKSEGIMAKTFLSSVCNGLIILLFAIISLGAVFLESQLLFKLGFPKPDKSVSLITPNQQQQEIGEIFPMQVKISGIKQSINAVRFDFSYVPTEIEVVDISTKDSFANIFIQKQIDNKAGFASFAGGLPNPGFSGNQGIFATIYLRGLKIGSTTLTFLPTSAVLANNGRGDNLLGTFGSASYLIVADLPNSEDASSKARIGTDVLGETTQTQMIFYNENEVLGASTAHQVTQPISEKSNFHVLDALGTLDTFILSIWKKIF